MIYIERTINIEDNSAYIEEPVILYKGDRNIEVQFIINNNPFKYKAGIDLTYGQLVIKRPTTDPIFSDVAKLSSGKVLFVITGEMIDELVELGNYDFQVRLLNEDKTSRATLPPVTAGILIKEPVCEEEGVNYSLTGYSRAATGEVLDVFDENGDYIKTTWAHSDLITDSKLNKIENALYEINDDIPTVPTDVSAFTNDAGYLTEHQSLEAYATKEELPIVPTDISAFANDIGYITDVSHLASKDELPTNVSELNNDAEYASEYYVKYYAGNTRNEAMNYALGLSNNKADKNHSHDEYLTEHQSLEGYATIDYVDESIKNIEVSGGGDIDLSGYATKEDLETKANAADVYTKDETATKAQINAALARKSAVDHNHDEEYSKINHVHDVTTLTGMYTNFYTKVQVDNKLVLNYYTKTEVYTKREVDSAIAEAQLGGEEVDLTGYATKTYVDDMLGDIESLLGGI